MKNKSTVEGIITMKVIQNEKTKDKNNKKKKNIRQVYPREIKSIRMTKKKIIRDLNQNTNDIY